MERRPARQISITNGVHIQVSTITMDQGASVTELSIEKDEAGTPVKNSTA